MIVEKQWQCESQILANELHFVLFVLFNIQDILDTMGLAFSR